MTSFRWCYVAFGFPFYAAFRSKTPTSPQVHQRWPGLFWWSKRKTPSNMEKHETCNNNTIVAGQGPHRRYFSIFHTDRPQGNPADVDGVAARYEFSARPRATRLWRKDQGQRAVSEPDCISIMSIQYFSRLFAHLPSGLARLRRLTLSQWILASEMR